MMIDEMNRWRLQPKAVKDEWKEKARKMLYSAVTPPEFEERDVLIPGLAKLMYNRAQRAAQRTVG